VDTRLNEDEAEFGILVFSVALEVLSDSDGLVEMVSYSAEGKFGWCILSDLLDQHVEVLWNFGCEA
jgi:hypothetical protein